MPKEIGASRTVLLHKEKYKEKKKSDPADYETSGLPKGCEYNQRGELCKRDARGFLYPLDEHGERWRYRSIQRPKEVEPDIWYGLTLAEKEKMVEEYCMAKTPKPSAPEPASGEAPVACARL